MMKKIPLVLASGVVLMSAPAAAAYNEVAVKDGGAVQGTVTFAGPPPALSKQVIGKDNQVCGDGEIVPNPVSVGANGALKNVIVFLDKVDAGKPWPKKDYVLNQQKCSFEPYLQVVPKDVKLTIKNSDPVLHNVHPFEHVGSSRRTLFNLAQPNQNQTNVMQIKTRRGQVVELACDAHAWMAGWLYVLEHPYFAVVGADGTFKIGDVPPGSYNLMAWHPVLGTQQQAITVAANGAAQAAFQFKGK
jgi:hypothetical protein